MREPSPHMLFAAAAGAWLVAFVLCAGVVGYGKTKGGSLCAAVDGVHLVDYRPGTTCIIDGGCVTVAMGPHGVISAPVPCFEDDL